MANRLDGKGSAHTIRIAKAVEAVKRNNETAPDKRRAFWKERGFNRQSQAASLVTTTVTEINAQAKIHKQRSEDWPMVPDLDSPVTMD